jgi:hypothetical protein
MKPIPWSDASTNIFRGDEDEEEDCESCDGGWMIERREKVEDLCDRTEALSKKAKAYRCSGVWFLGAVRRAFRMKVLI